MDKKTVLLTFPATKPQKRCLRLGAAEAEASMSAFMRDAIGAALEEVRPDLAEVWESASPARRGKRHQTA
jgi:hypothetical protein